MIHRKQQLMLYTDVGYTLKDIKGDKLIRGEAGIIKLVNTDYLKAIIGMGWSYETKTIKSYLFVSL